MRGRDGTGLSLPPRVVGETGAATSGCGVTKTGYHDAMTESDSLGMWEQSGPRPPLDDDVGLERAAPKVGLSERALP